MGSDNEWLDSSVYNLNPILWQYPFLRKEMTVREYFEEREHYDKHRTGIRTDDDYEPLWKSAGYTPGYVPKWQQE